ncbi:Pentatricopeptide repeat superfamily protein [Perilla frutescens var. hirtella]|uniref:Pentatricopeptide repeat superfamily protein n=1 Tax=Perilla frutescens var. hirtella TaxID=608512 RepID=A0AAD4JFI8_PERFH|nr:Pentatricopeptide repeat superfamily protein [Perilla frutescens var. hirtella]
MVYVSFGSVAAMDKEKLQEVAWPPSTPTSLYPSLNGRSANTSVVFYMLILALVTNRKVDLAFEGFMRMRAWDYGFKLSVRSCNSMLAALVRCGKIGNVEFAYKEMVRRRIEADLTTFNTVVNRLCKAGRLNKASDIVEHMSVYGVTTSVVTYNTLIDDYCKRGGAGRMYKADALLKKMVEKGLSPSVITYNILIDGFCKDDNLAASLRLLKEMKEQGVRPSVITYNTLINGLCADGKIDEAMSLRDEMVGRVWSQILLLIMYLSMDIPRRKC